MRRLSPPSILLAAALVLLADRAVACDTITIKNVNADKSAKIRLYDASGNFDESALETFRKTLGEGDQPVPVEARTLKLVYKAACHFKNATVVVISSFRAGAKQGLHGKGNAIDFKLAGVKATTLASYLRKLPKVGVGLYTHPKTQYVHLDVRDTSFHWLDGSPPGVHWKERMLKDKAREKRDASYSEASDAPEKAS